MNRRWVQLSSIIVHVPPVQPRVGGKLEVLQLFEILACTLFISSIVHQATQRQLPLRSNQLHTPSSRNIHPSQCVGQDISLESALWIIHYSPPALLQPPRDQRHLSRAQTFHNSDWSIIRCAH
ncbi:hypothetical protein P167DRAFT_99296 [Morchella conica CCBAS932]|uniref:Uncharacterized protein n=1 Tax=Morchella conica CCBAS932 TaxID=1392247 RepID=A0A3N4K7T6_9PEZI|nr:hypothetical protein P167DRAFT_99296 [Morchella conica CCBAS932]